MLCLAVIGILIAVIWRIRADFYEDAMAKSEETAAALAQAKEKGGVATRKRNAASVCSETEKSAAAVRARYFIKTCTIADGLPGLDFLHPQ